MIRDFSDHPQGATASRAQGDIDIEDTLESLCPGELCEEWSLETGCYSASGCWARHRAIGGSVDLTWPVFPGYFTAVKPVHERVSVGINETDALLEASCPFAKSIETRVRRA